MAAKAEELAKKQREISVAEFFEKNRHLLGFDNKKKALLTAVKEAVDNSLDACEEAGILPDISVEIIDMQNDRFRIVVEDNGPGIVKQQVPKIFAKLLYGSKFHYTRYWTIPRCSRITSSMVDPSSSMKYMNVITRMAQWIPDFYSMCIKQFTKKNDRDFIYQRYQNQMIFGPRIHWKKNAIEEYNDFPEKIEVMAETMKFWKDLF